MALDDLSPGSHVDPDALHALAREAWEASGLTQAALGDALGVTQPSVANALGDRHGMDDLRRRIVHHCAGVELHGPVYVVA